MSSKTQTHPRQHSRRSSPERWCPVVQDVYIPLKVGSIDGTDTQAHDRAIIRAEKSEYYPNKKVSGDPRHTVFVGRLSPRTVEATLVRFFSEYGRVKRCRLVRDIVTGASKRYAFVEYERSSEARTASREANKLIVDKEEILVDMECERVLDGWKPRRLGGGFGGRKESGQLRFGGKARPFLRPIDAFTGQQQQGGRGGGGGGGGHSSRESGSRRHHTQR